MSSFAYPDLAATVAPDMQTAYAPAPVDQVMPQPTLTSQNYLHALGEQLASLQQQPQQRAAAPKNSNLYSQENSSNPYAISHSAFDSYDQKKRGEGGGAASDGAGATLAHLASLISR